MPCLANTGTDKSVGSPVIKSDKQTLRLGYVRLLDAAPYIVANELGLFRDQGLRVALSREVGWATIRSRIAYGELQAAQALLPMPFSLTLGLSTPKIPTKALMVTSFNGNAITLSEDLWKREVRDVDSLAREIRGTRSIRRYTFGIVAQHSSHDRILRDWLKSAGIEPEKDVQIVVLPPEQMVRCLASGNVDGFCVGEPWNSWAVRQKLGWCPAVSADLYDFHPEKVLLATSNWVDSAPDQVVALIRSLYESCRWCQDPENLEELLSMLSHERNLNCPREYLRPALSGNFPLGHGRSRKKRGFISFHHQDMNRPGPESADWALTGLLNSEALDIGKSPDARLVERVFDPRYFNQAVPHPNEF